MEGLGDQLQQKPKLRKIVKQHDHAKTTTGSLHSRRAPELDDDSAQSREDGMNALDVALLQQAPPETILQILKQDPTLARQLDSENMTPLKSFKLRIETPPRKFGPQLMYGSKHLLCFDEINRPFMLSTGNTAVF